MDKNNSQNTKNTLNPVKNLIDSCIKKIDSFLINNKISEEKNGAANSD